MRKAAMVNEFAEGSVGDYGQDIEVRDQSTGCPKEERSPSELVAEGGLADDCAE
jgi:hypothetical protein